MSARDEDNMPPSRSGKLIHYNTLLKCGASHKIVIIVIEFLAKNDKVQKINEVSIETKTPALIKIHCSHTMKSHQG